MTALLCVLAAALPSLEASVSVGSSVRRLFYRDRVTQTLVGWKSGALAVWGLSLQAHPSTGRLPILDDVGAYGWYKRSLESSTLTADNVLAFSTQEIAWEAGLRWRVMSDSRERGAVSVGYGSLRQVFSGAVLLLVMLFIPNGLFSLLPLGRRAFRLPPRPPRKVPSPPRSD